MFGVRCLAKLMSFVARTSEERPMVEARLEDLERDEFPVSPGSGEIDNGKCLDLSYVKQ